MAGLVSPLLAFGVPEEPLPGMLLGSWPVAVGGTFVSEFGAGELSDEHAATSHSALNAAVKCRGE